jgi:hypothetical protein
MSCDMFRCSIGKLPFGDCFADRSSRYPVRVCNDGGGNCYGTLEGLGWRRHVSGRAWVVSFHSWFAMPSRSPDDVIVEISPSGVGAYDGGYFFKA